MIVIKPNRAWRMMQIKFCVPMSGIRAMSS